MRIFEVEYNTVTDGDWDDGVIKDTDKVHAKDAMAAVEKVKKRYLNESWDWEDDDGKKQKSRYTHVEIIGVRLVAESEY